MFARTFRLTIIAVCLLATAMQAFGADETDGIDQPVMRVSTAFTLRVNPKWAARVNTVLARIAEPIEGTIVCGAIAQDYIALRCGGYNLPNSFTEEPLPGGAGTKIRFAPCVRIKRDTEIKAAPGNTLEGIVVRHGLNPTAVQNVLRIPKRNASDLQVGDIVKLPETPLWTDINTKPNIVADKAALMSVLAGLFDCGSDSAEACLLKHDVYVLDRYSTAPETEKTKPKLESVEPRTELQFNDSQPETANSRYNRSLSPPFQN